MHWAPQVALVVKNLPVNAGDVRDVGSVPGLGRSPGGGHAPAPVSPPRRGAPGREGSRRGGAAAAPPVCQPHVSTGEE